jgi:SAM-dependent methyltransferase
MLAVMNTIKHLPLQIDPEHNRHHYYETLWKVEALKLLQKYESSIKGMSLLDYGCGRGETMKLATDLGMQATGTDMDPECVELSSRYGRAEVLNLADPVSQFGENSYDVVACFHVLEHVPSPVETLQALRRIARKYVLLAVPNLSAFHDLLRPSKWFYPVNEGHLQSWDHAHFKNLVERHGNLEVIDWAFDTVIIPPISNIIVRFFGQKIAIRLETGLFKRIHPYASLSIIALAQKKLPAK